MKIKTDFVTNSSSTSFIVAWDKEIQQLCDIEKYISNKKHALLLWQMAQRQKPYKLQQGNFDFDMNSVLKNITRKLMLIFESGYFDGFLNPAEAVYDYQDKHKCSFRDAVKESVQAMADMKKENTRMAEVIIRRFIEENKGRVLYIFELSDEDGEVYSQMEHGNIFRSLPSLNVSHH